MDCMPGLVGGFGNYFLPVQMGAPDYFNYLKYFSLLLFNTLKKALLLYIFKDIDFWTCPINFTDKNKNSDCINTTPNSLSLWLCSLQESGATVGGAGAAKSIINNNSNNGPALLKAESLGPYLAGLVEGDGHISLSKAIKVNSTVKNTSPYIAITFVNKDLPLINKLVEKFGGRLRFKIKENAIVWTICKHKELVNMINLLNGNLRTPKILKFNGLIVWLNEKI